MSEAGAKDVVLLTLMRLMNLVVRRPKLESKRLMVMDELLRETCCFTVSLIWTLLLLAMLID